MHDYGEMVEITWAEYSQTMTDADVAMINRVREILEPLADVSESVTRTQIAWKRARTFISGYIKSHYFEIAIDLVRTADHPRLKAAFPTSKRVITHRFTIHTLDELDESIASLIHEAWKTVGPGFR